MTPDNYNNVWVYRQLTDLLVQLMDEGDMSPTDVIESARLACDMYLNDTRRLHKREYYGLRRNPRNHKISRS